jgi:hypothetical protein
MKIALLKLAFSPQLAVLVTITRFLSSLTSCILELSTTMSRVQQAQQAVANTSLDVTHCTSVMKLCIVAFR